MLGFFLPALNADRALLQALSSEKGLVGVKEIRNSRGASIRIFYPAAETNSRGARAAPLFRSSLALFVEGYIWTVLGGLGLWPSVNRVVSFLLSLFAWLHPLAWTSAPRCFVDLKPCTPSVKLPLIVWSHGLTGTGSEHSLLAAALALRGFVVALVHHSDGSSSLVDLQPAFDRPVKLRYKHPSYTPKYDVTLRQRQAEHRAQEVEEARRLIFFVPALVAIIDPVKVVVAGFSFGAATAGLAAALNPKAFAAAILVDGWWHIELKKLGVNQDLPLQVHSEGISIPALFIGSAEFEGYAALRDATRRVQAKASVSEVHILPGTRHGNFMDAVWWLPRFVVNGLGLAGSADPHETYVHFASLVAGFVERHTAGRLVSSS